MMGGVRDRANILSKLRFSMGTLIAVVACSHNTLQEHGKLRKIPGKMAGEKMRQDQRPQM